MIGRLAGSPLARMALASVSMALAGLALVAPGANAATTPARVFTCLAGLPEAAPEEKHECPDSTPSYEDMGRPIDSAVAPGEHTLYVLERAENVIRGGGEESVDHDTIVQEHLEGDRPPTFVSCISAGATPDCTRIPTSVLFHAYSMVLAPNKSSLYVSSRSGVSRFRISEAGTLSFAECIGTREADNAEGDFEPCSRPNWSETTGTDETLALAPGEQDLYFLGESGLRDIHLGSEGQMTGGNCYGFRSRCPWDRDDSGYATVTADGKWVLDVPGAPHGDDIDVYRRLPDGSLVFTSCLSGGGVACPAAGGAPVAFRRLQSIAVAPNDRDVYVTSGNEDSMPSAALIHLTLNSDGTLEFVGCESNDAAGCAAYPSADPAESGMLAIAPDGKHLFQSSWGALDVYRLSASGVPEWEACAGSGPLCEPGSLSGAGTVDVSPEGHTAWIPGSSALYGVLLDASAYEEAMPATPSAVDVAAEPNEDAEFGTNVRFSGTSPSAGPHTAAFFELERASGEITYLYPQSETRAGAGSRYEAEQEVPRATTVRARLVLHSAAGTAYGPWSESVATEACKESEAPESWEADRSPTSTSIVVWGLINVKCQATEVTLEYGETTSLGKTVTLPATALEIGRHWQPYQIEATGLKPNTPYYLRVVARNDHGRMKEIENGRTTTHGSTPAVETSAATVTATQVSATSVKLTGEVKTGGTAVQGGFALFEPTEEGPRETELSGPVLQPSEAPVTFSVEATDLQCGRTYTFLARSVAEYGESRGLRVPFELSCAAGEVPSHEEPGGGVETEPGPGEPPTGGPKAGEGTPVRSTPAILSGAMPEATPIIAQPPPRTTGDAGGAGGRRVTVLRVIRHEQHLLVEVDADASERASITVVLTRHQDGRYRTAWRRDWTVRLAPGAQTLMLKLDREELRSIEIAHGERLTATIRPQ